MSEQVVDAAATGEIPRFRYGAALANEIEARWQDRWELDGTYRAPNPTGPLSEGFDPERPKLFVMDMFPYPCPQLATTRQQTANTPGLPRASRRR